MNLYEQQVYQAGSVGGMPSSVASLLVAQAKHESANFTSSVFRNNNNLFGYKYVGQSGAMQGSISPEGDYYAKYANVAASALEVVNWWKRRIKAGKIGGWHDIDTAEKYGYHLKANGYYGDSLKNYVTGLQRWFKDFGELKNEGLTVLVVCLFAALAYYFKLI